MRASALLLACLQISSGVVLAQATVYESAQAPTQTSSQTGGSRPGPSAGTDSAPDAPETEVPAANPSRPTVTNPALLPPVGYLQFEQGVLFATAGPGGVAQQVALVQATKLAVHPRLMLQLLSEPFAATRQMPGTADAASTRDPGDLVFGVQGLLAKGGGAVPTVAVAYNRRLRAGSSADLDIGSYAQSGTLLVSGNAGKFHYDSNFGVTEQVASQAGADLAPTTLRRAQYLQSISLSHDLLPLGPGKKIQITGELWHATQPLVDATVSRRSNPRSNAVGALAAFGYAMRPNLVVDAGFDHGLTSTSTEWEGFAGFTYLLPHRLWRRGAESAAGRRGHGHS